MKRLIAMIALLAVLLYVSGCGAPQVETTTTTTVPADEGTGVQAADEITQGLDDGDTLDTDLDDTALDDVLGDLGVLDEA